MNTLIILALLDYIDDLSEAICNVIIIAYLALKKKDQKIFFEHLRKNMCVYFLTLFLPILQALLYILGKDNVIILITLVALTVLKKWKKSFSIREK